MELGSLELAAVRQGVKMDIHICGKSGPDRGGKWALGPLTEMLDEAREMEWNQFRGVNGTRDGSSIERGRADEGDAEKFQFPA